MNTKNALQRVINAGYMAAHPFQTYARIRKAIQYLTLQDQNGWEFLNGGPTWAGRNVSRETLFQIPATFSALRLISETVATLPLYLFRETKSGSEKARDHYLFRRTHWEPSEDTTAVEWLEGLTVGLACYGQGYNRTVREDDGNRESRIVSMQAYSKSWVNVEEQASGGVLLKVNKGGKTQKYSYADLMPIKGFGGPERREGLAPHQVQRQSLAITAAAEEYAGRFFGQGATPRGVLMVDVDGPLSKDQRDGFREEFGFLNGDLDEVHRMAVLPAHVKYSQVSSNNVDAQTQETRNHQVAEVARIFRIPLDFLMHDGSKATYANQEQRNAQLLAYTLRPYLVRIERSLTKWLLTEKEKRDGYYFDFETNALLRGDAKARAAYYRDMRIAGAMTQNEIRRNEGLPDKGPAADDLHVPLNMAPNDMLRDIHGSDNNA